MSHTIFMQIAREYLLRDVALKFVKISLRLENFFKLFPSFLSQYEEKEPQIQLDDKRTIPDS